MTGDLISSLGRRISATIASDWRSEWVGLVSIDAGDRVVGDRPELERVVICFAAPRCQARVDEIAAQRTAGELTSGRTRPECGCRRAPLARTIFPRAPLAPRPARCYFTGSRRAAASLPGPSSRKAPNSARLVFSEAVWFFDIVGIVGRDAWAACPVSCDADWGRCSC